MGAATLRSSRPQRAGVSGPVVGALVVGAACASALLVSAWPAQPLIPLAAVGGLALLCVAIMHPLLVAGAALLAVPMDGVLPIHRVSTLVMLVAGLGWLVRWATASPIRLPRNPTLTGFAAFVGVVAAGMLVAPEPFVVARLVLTYGTMLLIAACIVQSARMREISFLMYAVALCGGLAGAVAIVDPQPLTAAVFAGNNVSRATGGLGSPNALGMLLGLTIPVQIALALRGTPMVRILGGTCFVLALAGMALSVSRGAFVGLAAACLVLAVWPPFRRSAMIVLPLVAVLALIGHNPASPFAGKVVDRLAEVRTNGQNNERLVVWRATPRMVADRPLFGMGGLEYAYFAPAYQLRFTDGIPTHAHNLLLTIVSENGLLGLSAFLSMLVALALALLRAVRSQDAARVAFGFAIAAAMTGFLVNGLLDYGLAAAPIAAVFFTMLACGAALGRPEPPSASPDLP